jgi:integrase
MLTDLQCRKAIAKDRAYKLTDAKGLHLHITLTGFKSWRFKYRVGKLEKLIVIGPYPEVTIAKARDVRDRYRQQLRDNLDPGVVRKQEQAAARLEAINTFEKIARQWHAVQKPRWSAKHAGQVIGSLELHVFPKLGKISLGGITPPMVLEVIRLVEASSIDIAKRVQRRMSMIFGFAIASGIGKDNPAAAIKDALAPMMRGRYPAITDLERLRAFMRAAELQDTTPQTRLANRFLALTGVRPSMVRQMPPDEIVGLESDSPEWCIPAERMKLLKDRKYRAEFDFIVPLSRQAVDVLREAGRRFGNAPFVFPSAAKPRRPMSDMTLTKFLRVVGYDREHVPHGWRSSFSTIMNKRAAQMKRPGDRALIDLMLAHLPGDVESDYNRYAYLDERRELAQAWADMLLEGFAPAASLMSDPLPRGIVRSQEPRRERPVTRRGPGRPRGRKGTAHVSARPAK